MSNRYEKQKTFWEHAGRVGYGNAMFTNQTVERHIVSNQWSALLDVAVSLGLNKQAKVLELGCGDGGFAKTILSEHFKQVDAYDASTSAIESARSQSQAGNVNYHVADLATHEFAMNDHWDAAFLKGFLHHVKKYAPDIIAKIAKVCPRVIILEPNGDNLIRKLLERTPAYARAGEDSFRLKDLVRIFHESGYEIKTMRRMTVVPPFLPAFLLPVMKRLESVVERTYGLDRLCSSYCLGFELHRESKKGLRT